jgi:hypothetical protein
MPLFIDPLAILILFPQEWITSLPLHLDLYAALKIEPPTFAHFPILLNPNGSKMSKRHGDIQVDDFIVSLSTPLLVSWDIFTFSPETRLATRRRSELASPLRVWRSPRNILGWKYETF